MWNFLLPFFSFLMSILVTPQKIVRYLEANGKNLRNNLDFATPEAVKVSCVQLKFKSYKNLKMYLQEMLQHTKAAVEEGAQIVVFPEHTGLMAGTIIPFSEQLCKWATVDKTSSRLDFIKLDKRRINRLVETFHNCLYEIYMYTFSTIARLQHVYIVAGTCPFYEYGKLYNRSVLFDPEGNPVGSQSKTSPIGFDSALGVAPSDSVEVFSTPLGNLSIVVGSDTYFFECFKIAKAKGAQIIAVPAAQQGVLRDLLLCRAYENDVFVLLSCLVAPDSGSEDHASVLCPPDLSTERGGIVKSAEEAAAGVVTARINLEKLKRPLLRSERNPMFLMGDYLHSYRYCGVVPKK